MVLGWWALLGLCTCLRVAGLWLQPLPVLAAQQRCSRAKAMLGTQKESSHHGEPGAAIRVKQADFGEPGPKRRATANKLVVILVLGWCSGFGSAVAIGDLVQLLPGGRVPPRRPDPASLARRRPQTIMVYWRALLQFLVWVASLGFTYRSPIEFDDLSVDWRFLSQVSKAVFAHAVSAVEMAVPTTRGLLTWSHAIMRDLVLA